MKKYLLVLLLPLFCFSCTTTIPYYYIINIQYPNWINTAYPNFIGENNKDQYVYNDSSIFLTSWGLYGAKDVAIKLFIDPSIEFEHLHIDEISFVKDEKRLYLIKDITIKNKNLWYNEIKNIRAKDGREYFGIMQNKETIEMLLRFIYRFDDNENIIEEFPYKIYCSIKEYNPLWYIIPYY